VHGQRGLQVVDRVAQGLFDQFILGFEMRIETTVGQAERLHQRLQAGRADAITAEAARRLVENQLVGSGLVVF
jgi:hypothetical protein